MTWTVTARGSANAPSGFATPANNVTLTVSGISAGDGIAVFAQYTDFQTDALTVADNAAGGSNSYGSIVENIFDSGSGQLMCCFVCPACGVAPTTITVTFLTTAVIQQIAAISFKNSVAGTPTLHSHHGLDNVAATSGNSGVATATNGDLVLTGICCVGGPASLGAAAALAITGVTSPATLNLANTASGYEDGWGLTTTTGNVTSTWSSLSGAAATIVLEMIISPPSATPSCSGKLMLMGVGCGIAARKIEENPILTRRSLLLPRRRSLIGHNGGPPLDE